MFDRMSLNEMKRIYFNKLFIYNMFYFILFIEIFNKWDIDINKIIVIK